MSSNAKKVVQRLFWGVDFKLLNQCVDEKVIFVKYELVIIILAVYTGWSYFQFGYHVRTFYVAPIAIILTIFVFLTYKMYLSNMYKKLTSHVNGFGQWLVSTVFAIGTAYFTIEGVLNIDIDSRISTSEIVLSTMTVIVALPLYYLPVRFEKNTDSLYAKLLLKIIEEEKKRAETFVREDLRQETQKYEVQIELNRKADAISSDLIADEIAQTRLRVAKVALEKWEEQQRELINRDIEKYIKS